MWSRVKSVISSFLPGVVQYPIIRAKKAYDNLYVYKRKVQATAIRLVSEIAGGVFSMSIVWMSSDAKEWLFSMSKANITNPLASEIAVYVGLFIAGYKISGEIAKQAIRKYYHHHYGFTNSEYINLKDEERESLAQKWGIAPEVSDDFFKYLTSKIKKYKKKHDQNSHIVAPHKQNFKNTKHILQIFRSAGQLDDGNLLLVMEYIEAQISKSETRVAECKNLIEHCQTTPSNHPPTHTHDPIEVVVFHPETKDVPLKDRLTTQPKNQNKSKLDFWHKKAKREGKEYKKHTTIIEMIQKEKLEHEHQIDTLKGFVVRMKG